MYENCKHQRSKNCDKYVIGSLSSKKNTQIEKKSILQPVNIMTFTKTGLWKALLQPRPNVPKNINTVIVDASHLIYAAKSDEDGMINFYGILRMFLALSYGFFVPKAKIMFCFDVYTTMSLERSMIAFFRQAEETQDSILQKQQQLQKHLDSKDMKQILDWQLSRKEYFSILNYRGFKKLLYGCIHFAFEHCVTEYGLGESRLDVLRDFIQDCNSSMTVYFRGLNQPKMNEEVDECISDGCLEVVSDTKGLVPSLEYDGKCNIRTREADNAIITLAIEELKNGNEVVMFSKDGDAGKSIFSMVPCLFEYGGLDSEMTKHVYYFVPSLDQVSNSDEQQPQIFDLSNHKRFFHLEGDVHHIDSRIKELYHHCVSVDIREAGNESQRLERFFRFRHSTQNLFLFLNHLGGSDFGKSPKLFNPELAFDALGQYLRLRGCNTDLFLPGRNFVQGVFKEALDSLLDNPDVPEDDFLILFETNPGLQATSTSTSTALFNPLFAEPFMNRYRILMFMSVYYETRQKKSSGFNNSNSSVVFSVNSENHSNVKNKNTGIIDLSELMAHCCQAFYALCYYMIKPIKSCPMPSYFTDSNLSGFDTNTPEAMAVLKKVDLIKNMTFIPRVYLSNK